MNTIRESVGILQQALTMLEQFCPLSASTTIRCELPETPAQLYPEFAKAAELAKQNPAAAKQLVKETLQKWSEQ